MRADRGCSYTRCEPMSQSDQGGSGGNSSDPELNLPQRKTPPKSQPSVSILGPFLRCFASTCSFNYHRKKTDQPACLQKKSLQTKWGPRYHRHVHAGKSNKLQVRISRSLRCARLDPLPSLRVLCSPFSLSRRRKRNYPRASKTP